MSKQNEIVSKNINPEIDVLSEAEQRVLEAFTDGEWKKYSRVAMAALSALPWVGSLIGAAATLSSENEQKETTKIIYLWVKEYEIKLKEVSNALGQIFSSFESFGARIEDRIHSEEYISLVRGTFKRWDEAETFEKKEMFRKLITNAGGIAVVQDDWVRMFLNWITQYDELHFQVIAEIHRQPGITRRDIWMKIKGSIPTDSSAEADVFKLLIDDLTRGRVIRQRREINSGGEFLKHKPQGKKPTTNTMESPFDTTDPYVLTDLGKGFVQYVMNELNLQIEA